MVEDDPDIALLGQIALEEIGGYQRSWAASDPTSPCSITACQG
jgi:hypothetical protein